MLVALKYIGGGAFIVGLPARDLSEDEVEELGGEEVLLETGLYERVKKRKKKAKDDDGGD